jgi:hypothetical protein
MLSTNFQLEGSRTVEMQDRLYLAERKTIDEAKNLMKAVEVVILILL